MQWEIETINEGKIIRVIIKGDFNVPDHLRLIEGIISNKDWRPGINALFDCRNVRFGENGFDLIWHASLNLAKYDSPIGNGKLAVLLKASNLVFGREFEMLTDERVSADMRIFLNEREALRWLEI